MSSSQQILTPSSNSRHRKIDSGFYEHLPSQSPPKEELKKSLRIDTSDRTIRPREYNNLNTGPVYLPPPPYPITTQFHQYNHQYRQPSGSSRGPTPPTKTFQQQQPEPITLRSSADSSAHFHSHRSSEPTVTAIPISTPSTGHRGTSASHFPPLSPIPPNSPRISLPAPQNTPITQISTQSMSPPHPTNSSHLSRSLSRSTSLLQRLTRKLSETRKAKLSQDPLPTTIEDLSTRERPMRESPPPADRMRQRAATTVERGQEERNSWTELKRSSTVRGGGPRRVEEHDQSFREEWRERNRGGKGFFDTREKIRPDVSAMPSGPSKPLSVHPSSLSTFAPRGPLVPNNATATTRTQQQQGTSSLERFDERSASGRKSRSATVQKVNQY